MRDLRRLRLRRGFGRPVAMPCMVVAGMVGALAIIALDTFLVAIPVPIPVAVPVPIAVPVTPRPALAAMRPAAAAVVARVIAGRASALPLVPIGSLRSGLDLCKALGAAEEAHEP